MLQEQNVFDIFLLFHNHCVYEIIARIDEEECSRTGIIAAHDVIDIVTKYYGPNAYNMGIEDSKKLIQTKLANVVLDLDIAKVAI